MRYCLIEPPFLGRLKKLLELSNKIGKYKIQMFLVYVNEAHTRLWPRPLTDKIEPQSCLKDRIKMARRFINEQKPNFEIYVDLWTNSFEELFRSWPDKYFLVNPKSLKIIERGIYISEKEKILVN